MSDPTDWQRGEPVGLKPLGPAVFISGVLIPTSVFHSCRQVGHVLIGPATDCPHCGKIEFVSK